MKHNYKIVVEMPRYMNTRQGRELTVDTFTQFIYERKNKEMALRKFMSVENLRSLRKNGFHITRAEVRKNRKTFLNLIERI
jgi:hypothetical protein